MVKRAIGAVAVIVLAGLVVVWRLSTGMEAPQAAEAAVVEAASRSKSHLRWPLRQGLWPPTYRWSIRLVQSVDGRTPQPYRCPG